MFYDYASATQFYLGDRETLSAQFFSPTEPVREQLHVTQHEHNQDLRVESFFAGCQRLVKVHVKPNSSLIFFLFIQGTIVSSGMLLSLYLLSLRLRY